MADSSRKVKCPHCNYEWEVLILMVGASRVDFTCANPNCKKKFAYKIINGKWRMVKEKEVLEEVERFGAFDL